MSERNFVRLFAYTFAVLICMSPANAERDEGIVSAVDSEAPATIDTIKELASIESGSSDPEGLAQMAERLEARLQSLGFETRRETSTEDVGADTIVGTMRGDGRQRVMLMAHMDTVYDRGILAEAPLREENGFLYGPGVLDAKGGIAIILHGIKVLNDKGWKDFDTLTVIFNPDEEIGSAGSGTLITEIASNMDTVLSFEPGGDSDRNLAYILYGMAAYAQVTMEVRGQASHAGAYPEKGRNAVIELAHQILATRDVSKDVLGAQLNWTNVISDKAYNQIPDLAVAVADARITVEGQETELLEALQARVAESSLIRGTEVEVSLEILRPGYWGGSDAGALAQIAQDAYTEYTRQPLYIVPMVRGASDAGYAAVSGNAIVLEGFGPAGAGIHSPNEKLSLKSIAPTLYQMTRMLMELGEAAQ